MLRQFHDNPQQASVEAFIKPLAAQRGGAIPNENETNDRGTVILTHATEFIKPDRDRRNYRIVKLANNLKALLVSTSEEENGKNVASVEAASVHIQAGHFDDTIAGISHFHEHMLVGTYRIRPI